MVAHEIRVGARVIASRGGEARERGERMPRGVAVGRELAGLFQGRACGVPVAVRGLALAEGGQRVGEHVLRMRAARHLDGARERGESLH